MSLVGTSKTGRLTSYLRSKVKSRTIYSPDNGQQTVGYMILSSEENSGLKMALGVIST